MKKIPTLLLWAALPLVNPTPATVPVSPACEAVRTKLAAIQAQPGRLIPFPEIRIDGAPVPPGPQTPVSSDLAQGVLRMFSPEGGVLGMAGDRFTMELDRSCTNLRVSNSPGGPSQKMKIIGITPDVIKAQTEGVEMEIKLAAPGPDGPLEAPGFGRVRMSFHMPDESQPLQCGGGASVVETHSLDLEMTWYHGPEKDVDALLEGPLMDTYLAKAQALQDWAVQMAEHPTLTCPQASSQDQAARGDGGTGTGDGGTPDAGSAPPAAAKAR